MSRNPCTVCGQPGVPGLLRGAGKCQYHYDSGQFGEEWADKCRELRGPDMKHTITTQKEIRALFWQEHPQFKRAVMLAGTQSGKTFFVEKRQNDYPTDVRVAFVDFVDHLHRDGQISDALAERVTL